MNIRRAAVIMASTSSEKSSKWISSMPSSDTRGMFAAWKCQREISDSKLQSFFPFFHSYKKQTVHQFWPANISPAWFKCWAVKVFIWETQTRHANRVWKQWEGEEAGMSRKYVPYPNWSSDIAFRLKADHFTATAITQYIPMQITVL